MIFLDTNVISELMRRAPDSRVLGWFDAQRASDPHLSAIVEAELRFGVLLLPQGQRKDALAAALDDVLETGRIAAFDSVAARAYSTIAARRRRTGLAVKEGACQIAAIVLSGGGTVATRNTRDFDETGVPTVNPWDFGD